MHHMLAKSKSRIALQCPVTHRAAYFGSIAPHAVNFGSITRHAKTLCHPHPSPHPAGLNVPNIHTKTVNSSLKSAEWPYLTPPYPSSLVLSAQWCQCSQRPVTGQDLGTSIDITPPPPTPSIFFDNRRLKTDACFTFRWNNIIHLFLTLLIDFSKTSQPLHERYTF